MLDAGICRCAVFHDVLAYFLCCIPVQDVAAIESRHLSLPELFHYTVLGRWLAKSLLFSSSDLHSHLLLAAPGQAQHKYYRSTLFDLMCMRLRERGNRKLQPGTEGVAIPRRSAVGTLTRASARALSLQTLDGSLLESPTKCPFCVSRCVSESMSMSIASRRDLSLICSRQPCRTPTDVSYPPTFNSFLLKSPARYSQGYGLRALQRIVSRVSCRFLGSR